MSQFIIFSIGKDYKKTINAFVNDKKIIKWELIHEKNHNNQMSIIIEYEETHQ